MTDDHLTNLECTTCGFALMRSPRSAINKIVFCTVCRSGGHYVDVIEQGKALMPDFITNTELEEMLHLIGSEAD